MRTYGDFCMGRKLNSIHGVLWRQLKASDTEPDITADALVYAMHLFSFRTLQPAPTRDEVAKLLGMRREDVDAVTARLEAHGWLRDIEAEERKLGRADARTRSGPRECPWCRAELVLVRAPVDPRCGQCLGLAFP